MQTLGCAAVSLLALKQSKASDGAPDPVAEAPAESPVQLSERKSSGITASPLPGHEPDFARKVIESLKYKTSDSSCSTSSGDRNSPRPSSSKIEKAHNRSPLNQSISPSFPMPRHHPTEDPRTEQQVAASASRAHFRSPGRQVAASEFSKAGIAQHASISNSTSDNRFAGALPFNGSRLESLADDDEGSTTSRLRMDLRLLGMETPPQLSRTALLALLMEQAANVSQRAQARPLPSSMAGTYYASGPRHGGYMPQNGLQDASGFNVRGGLYPRVFGYAHDSMWSPHARNGPDVFGTLGGSMLGNEHGGSAMFIPSHGGSAIQRLRTIEAVAQQSKMAVMVRESQFLNSHAHFCLRTVDQYCQSFQLAGLSFAPSPNL